MQSIKNRLLQSAATYLSLIVLCWVAAACAPIALTRPVVKIGLVAPFEGEQRAVGYEALYAVKLALRDVNEQGGVAGWNVELVALDDSNHIEQAVRQTQSLAVDRDVVFALGISAPSEHEILRAQFAKVAMPASVLDSTPTAAVNIPAEFVERYRTISGGSTPGVLASQTYAATQQGLAQIGARIRSSGKPAR